MTLQKSNVSLYPILCLAFESKYLWHWDRSVSHKKNTPHLIFQDTLTNLLNAKSLWNSLLPPIFRSISIFLQKKTLLVSALIFLNFDIRTFQFLDFKWWNFNILTSSGFKMIDATNTFPSMEANTQHVPKVILSRTLNRNMWHSASLGSFDEKKYFYSRAFSTVVGMLAKFE